MLGLIPSLIVFVFATFYGVCCYIWNFISKIFKTFGLYFPLHRAWAKSEKEYFFTIKVSHFCDKSRWALDCSRSKYEEITSTPLFHLFNLYHTGGTTTSTPFLITSEKKLLKESYDINQYLFLNGNKWIYPNEESRELEKYFDREL